ncbi:MULTISPECIES: hypothetical protein [unclassified Arcicella]|uniref:hypothetical protein n=1 Tax=unclassified Arcicella TaxID=2644986 RepID=UPI002863A46A|nr:MULTISPECIES: hypothetical protein [unclassified Arcicella]MDR6565014.1 hypothetical protein [Arcicella sp. BE51]MDR6814807.1 hypothetical protein [Arcicella sp. BE140]MDR6826253.1 hypothetical protein [Arcicella sp. BE139]
MNSTLLKISNAWEMDGFLGLLRDRVFNVQMGEDFLHNLQSIEFDSIDCIPKDTVKILWYIPIFMEWRDIDLKYTLEENEYKKYINLKSKILNHLEEILGMP